MILLKSTQLRKETEKTKKVVPNKTLTSESKQTNQNKEKYLRASVTYRQQFCPLLLLRYLLVIFGNSNSLIEDSIGQT